jgi:hypothetical protein
MDYLTTQPKDLSVYIDNPQTANYMLKIFRWTENLLRKCA